MNNTPLENSGSVAILPADIVVEILSNFPEKQLNMFRRVCSRWRHLIDTHFSLYGKFLSMQRRHDAEIDTTINELEQFRDAYTIMRYRNIFFIGGLNDIFDISLISVLGLIIVPLFTYTLLDLHKQHKKQPAWHQKKYADVLNQIDWILSGVILFTIAFVIGMSWYSTNRQHNEHRARNVTPEILDKLQNIYNRRQLFFNELPDSATKQLFFRPAIPAPAVAGAAPAHTNQWLANNMTEDCARLPRLKETLSSHANSLVRKNSVDRNQLSNYCLSLISRWNNDHPRRQIPVFDPSDTNNLVERKANLP